MSFRSFPRYLIPFGAILTIFIVYNFSPTLVPHTVYRRNPVRWYREAESTCVSTELPSDLQTLDLYEKIDFTKDQDDLQRVEYNQSTVNRRTLNVILVPHAHCDPGWLKTFEGYYEDQTKNILDNMVIALEEMEEMRFIFAEMSFMEMWWKKQTDATKDSVRDLIKSGRLELVTGGWVMTDEANSHFHTMINQLIEGHEFILNNFGEDAIPTSHWSIDPFGLSPTLTHLMALSNISHAAVNRIHYALKNTLGMSKSLEVKWRQLFATSSRHDVLTHIFPYELFSTTFTCGPHRGVCCQFNYRSLVKQQMCPGGQPVDITDENVAERAALLLDQYRRKAELTASDVIMVQVGDDFAFDSYEEWNLTYTNYQKLSTYMNKNMNVNIRFGTLRDYFTALTESIGDRAPSLTGDFFTYADNPNSYWSGYFTSRPYYKKLGDTLASTLRSTEILATLAAMQKKAISDENFSKLLNAKRSLALFQHHDGVTGTARELVMADYGQKMHKAIRQSEDVATSSVGALLGLHEEVGRNEERSAYDELPKIRIYVKGQRVIVFNSATHQKTKVVCIHVARIDSVVEGDVKQQISPLFEAERESINMVEGTFKLCFSITVPAMSLKVLVVGSGGAIRTNISSAVGRNMGGFEWKKVGKKVVISNSLVSGEFDSRTGHMTRMDNLQLNKSLDINVSFGMYESSGSGAYIFRPTARLPIHLPPKWDNFIVVDGPLRKEVLVVSSKLIVHQYSLSEGDYFVDIDTIVDIRDQQNSELAMVVSTNVTNGDNFFTDLNGFQNIRRKQHPDLPTGANFYPMTSSAFLQDSSTRFSLLTAQPQGVANFFEGQLIVILDRRLVYDDGKGLSEGVMDNKKTNLWFRLLFEPLKAANLSLHYDVHSAYGNQASFDLTYPMDLFQTDEKVKSTTLTLAEELNEDLQLINLRLLTEPNETSPKGEAAVLFHRPRNSCRSLLKSVTNGLPHQLNLEHFLGVKEAKETSLTLLHVGSRTNTVDIEPFDVRTFKVSW